ncbi:ketose-bisphosphate aldolase [Enterococcus hulanensis]|uniref:Ketose-bisphosphate aldolase n=1 Tax=Enterococcus hulanensis TaxID=2559929 RepID=A0ABU3EWV2_9ENTE|nr:ketose-bisphosphate aldolase [Enterococcus hulanensis]MDT2599162.1 ketose-bisphosphate aldolase [Enterococcus hulanensis]MDT2608569.1 ketose-bisphosphate aldolase [Enterococcus hulanensis]MDT2616324.1 ketose-bisphosphate aldolase [Enterococcus hulanensis]MDT2627636.1 ketose-bisphosphate aldolase [Enterococcus hulanensis]MDT2655666.1 ketose-bisphosphate aldolase [Enterococcus hulanensis]
MLYTMKDLLKVAKENQFAVPAFNICSYDMMKAIMEEVEAQNAPVILEIHPDEIAYLNDEFVAAAKDYAHNSKVPVVIHMDHGGSVKDVMRAIRNGYTSVMIDASTQTFEDNMSLTKEVVKLAHDVNVSVEAELGTIGNNGSAEGGSANIIYTDPNQAEEFVKETGIDTLAVAIGTAHGLYPKDMTPKLNIELLKELNERIDIPFVLHGGSGNPDSEVSEAVKYGVAKVNLSSDLKSVFFDALREVLTKNPKMYEPGDVFPEANDKVKEVVKHKLRVLNTIGKAELY